MLAQSFGHRLVDFGLHRPVVRDGHPRFDGDGDARVAQLGGAHEGRGVFEHARVFTEHVGNDFQGAVQVGAVGDVDRQIGLPDDAVVVDDLADDLAVRHHDAGKVGVNQGGREQFNRVHLPMHAGDLDVFADPKTFHENNGQTRDQIAQDALHGEADADARDAQSGDERQEFDLKIVRDEQQGQDEHEELHDADEQHEDGRLHLPLFKLAHRERAQPAPHDGTDNEKHQRNQDVGPVLLGEADEGFAVVREGFAGSIHYGVGIHGGKNHKHVVFNRTDGG